LEFESFAVISNFLAASDFVVRGFEMFDLLIIGASTRALKARQIIARGETPGDMP
jgi:hypothetical protein